MYGYMTLRVSFIRTMWNFFYFDFLKQKFYTFIPSVRISSIYNIPNLFSFIYMKQILSNETICLLCDLKYFSCLLDHPTLTYSYKCIISRCQ